MELIAAHIHSKHACRALLQKHLRKAPGGRACVEANAAVYGKAEGVQRGLKLPGAARDIALGFKDFQPLIRPDFEVLS